MKAFIRDRYGGPDVLEFTDIEMSVVADDGVLVRVQASSVNQADLDYLYGIPAIARLGTGLRRPTNRGLGLDVAGQVESVGKDVTLEEVPQALRYVEDGHALGKVVITV